MGVFKWTNRIGTNSCEGINNKKSQRINVAGSHSHRKEPSQVEPVQFPV